MSIFESIQKDHVIARDIMQSIQQTTIRTARTREKHYEKFLDVILPHMEAEEQTLYASLMEHHDARPLAMKAYEEHTVVKMVINSLDSLAKEDESWAPRFEVLSDILHRHMDEEEGRLFDLARSAMSEARADELEAQFDQTKRAIKSRIR